MSNSIRRLTTDWQRLTTLLAGYTNERERVWYNKHLKKRTKLQVYRAVALTTLLYGFESWVTCRHHLHLLEHFHQCCLCSILTIHWKDYVTNVVVLKQVDTMSIEAMLLKLHLHWVGHITRMKNQRLPKETLYGEIYPLAIVIQGS